MGRLEFWYDFASPYAYLTAKRIEAVAGRAGVGVVWRPFLLGPTFAAQGWSTSPFNIYPAKGRYMRRDVERIAAERGVAWRMPQTFPANSVAAARLALAGPDDRWTGIFSRAVFDAGFGRGENIADHDVLQRIATEVAAPGDATRIVEAASTNEIKQKLRLQSNRAIKLGVFGAPTLICGDGELFWGDDRLEHAVRWAQVL
jgi:2-hydroxychromene-2-carboxylate isomerase